MGLKACQVLSVVLATREEIVLSTDGEPLRPTEMEDDEDAVRNLAGPSAEAMEKFMQHGRCRSMSRSLPR